MNKLLLATLIFIYCSGFSYGEDIIVVDGDTIKVKKEGKWYYCRLYGIDAPERSQPMGVESQALLAHLIKESEKSLLIMSRGKDKYGRVIVKLYNMTSPTTGVELNQFMVSSGFAWWYKQYSSDNGGYKVAQEVAQRKKIGIWSTKDPIPPWIYRKKKK